MDFELPFELLIRGYPISHQTKRRLALEAWKEDVRTQARAQLGEGVFASTRILIATVYFFPRALLEADLDNAAKPILDGLGRCAFVDDRQIERLVIQRFEPGRRPAPAEESALLNEALVSRDPMIYIRLDAFDEEQVSVELAER